MKNPLKTLSPNTTGRDFVIGDLHGSFSRLIDLLDHLNFDASRDRLISVGDLVDRGPDSLLCLQLLGEPWFYSILSNHEQMMLEAFDGGYMGMFWGQNGGGWGFPALNAFRNQERPSADATPMTAEAQDLIDLIPLVRELPFMLTVEMPGGGKFHIIHAELPPGYLITDETLADPEAVMKLATVQTENGDFLVWGRHLYYPFCRMQLHEPKVKRSVAYFKNSLPFNDKLSHIISGHTIVQRPLTIVGQTNIDTCAYGSYDKGASWQALTCIELGTWTFTQVTAEGVRSCEPLVVNRADFDKPEKSNDEDADAG
jgi:Calcineurin-like phosphoesterase